MSTAGEISGRKGVRHDFRKEVSAVRDGQDWYIEPGWAVEVLIANEEFGGLTWDPCAGSGTIPRHLGSYGCHVVASDIVDRGLYAGLIGDTDFTGPTPRWLPAVENIVMNPPYRQADQFVRLALQRATRKVAVLVQAKFPYSQRRHDLFIKHPPARIYFLSTRPSMPPGELLISGKIKAAGGKLDYLWLVWDLTAPQAPTVARWLKRGAA